MQRILEIDLIGCALLGCGMIPLMMGLIWGGKTYNWNSAAVISCLVVGVFGFFVFINFGLRRVSIFSSPLRSLSFIELSCLHF